MDAKTIAVNFTLPPRRRENRVFLNIHFRCWRKRWLNLLEIFFDFEWIVLDAAPHLDLQSVALESALLPCQEAHK